MPCLTDVGLYQINRLATAREVLLAVVEIDDAGAFARGISSGMRLMISKVSIRKSFGGTAHALLAASGKPGSRLGRNTREAADSWVSERHGSFRRSGLIGLVMTTADRRLSSNTLTLL